MQLCGYAYLWGDLGYPTSGQLSMIAPGALSLSLVRLHRNHYRQLSFATTFDGSLRLWQDSHGIAFEADVDDSGLARDVCSGAIARVSPSWSVIERRRQHLDFDSGTVFQNGVDVTVRGRLKEISLVSDAAFSAAGVWLPEWSMRDMPPGLREQRRAWKRRDPPPIAAHARRRPAQSARAQQSIPGALARRRDAAAARIIAAKRRRGARGASFADIGMPVIGMPVASQGAQAYLSRLIREVV
jgi:phage head maturation protease